MTPHRAFDDIHVLKSTLWLPTDVVEDYGITQSEPADWIGVAKGHL